MHRTLRGAAALVVALAAFTVTACGGTPPSDAIGVNALAADPIAFTGEIAVEGVVIEADDASSSLTLIDVTEYELCGLSPCAGAGILPLHLPASGDPSPSGAFYDGALPALEETVVVVGTVRSNQGGLYFDVERIYRGSQTLMTRR